MVSLLLQRVDRTGLQALVGRIPARGELVGVLANPFGDEPGGAAGE